MEKEKKQLMPDKWLDWAKEMQSIAQNGLAYTKDAFDKERFERIREISAEIVASYSDLPLEKAKELFCNETGFQTPKMDTRAAVFKGQKILLVQEKDGRWSLPGGWVDFDRTIKTNTEKEVKEEAGLSVKAVKIIAVQDRNLHNKPVYAYNVCKFFVLCEALGGSFQKNPETIASGYFSLNDLPPLSEEKNTKEQIELCFSAYASLGWETVFD